MTSELKDKSRFHYTAFLPLDYTVLLFRSIKSIPLLHWSMLSNIMAMKPSRLSVDIL